MFDGKVIRPVGTTQGDFAGIVGGNGLHALFERRDFRRHAGWLDFQFGLQFVHHPLLAFRPPRHADLKLEYWSDGNQGS
jgi:hypothetical protein